MTADRAGAADRVVTGRKRIDVAGIEVDQVGIGSNRRPAGGGDAMGIMTHGARDLFVLDMGAMA